LSDLLLPFPAFDFSLAWTSESSSICLAKVQEILYREIEDVVVQFTAIS